jgi:hypothetical protein
MPLIVALRILSDWEGSSSECRGRRSPWLKVSLIFEDPSPLRVSSAPEISARISEDDAASTGEREK